MKVLLEAGVAADKAVAAATAANEVAYEAYHAALIAFSRYSWVEATKAAHPPSAEWTAADTAGAEAAWEGWFGEFRERMFTAEK